MPLGHAIPLFFGIGHFNDVCCFNAYFELNLWPLYTQPSTWHVQRLQPLQSPFRRLCEHPLHTRHLFMAAVLTSVAYTATVFTEAVLTSVAYGAIEFKAAVLTVLCLLLQHRQRWHRTFSGA